MRRIGLTRRRDTMMGRLFARCAAHRAWHAVALCILSLTIAGTASAQDQSCTDDNGQQRCDQNAIMHQNQLFDTVAIANMAAQEMYVRRAFFVDGYGQDVLAISFVRVPGREPMVELRLPNGWPTPLLALSATIPIRIWDEAVERGALFDRELVPPNATAVPSPPCLHSWVTRVESADPPRQMRVDTHTWTIPAVVRGKTGSSCGQQLHTRYAFALANLAMEALPNCKLLSEEQERNVVTRLRTCALLNGDRVSAAYARNMFAALMDAVSNRKFNDQWRSAFAQGAEVTVDDRSLAVGDAIYDALRTWAEPYRSMTFHLGVTNGIDAHTVESRGAISAYRADAATDSRGETARFTIRWTERAGQFLIERIEIKPFTAR